MLTDGQLAKEDMRRWAHHPDAAEELVDVGWWEDRGAHYQIINHLGYQRTKKQVAKQSNANAENANRRWTKKKPPQDNPSNDSQCDSQSDSTYEMDRTGQAFKRGGAIKAKSPTALSLLPRLPSSCAASTRTLRTGTSREADRAVQPDRC
jgi:hypothetical protein